MIDRKGGGVIPPLFFFHRRGAMTGAEFFQNLTYLRKQMDRSRDRMREAEEEAAAVRGVRYDITGGKSGGPRASSVEKAAELIEERRGEYAEAAEAFYREWNKVQEARSRFSDPILYDVAAMRYHLGKPWADIGKKLGYCRRSLNRYDRQLMQEAAWIIPGLTA